MKARFYLDFSSKALASMAQMAACPTGNQEVMGVIPVRFSSILSPRLIIKYFLRSFSFAGSRRAVVSFWQKNVHKYWFPA